MQRCSVVTIFAVLFRSSVTCKALALHSRKVGPPHVACVVLCLLHSRQAQYSYLSYNIWGDPLSASRCWAPSSAMARSSRQVVASQVCDFMCQEPCAYYHASAQGLSTCLSNVSVMLPVRRTPKQLCAQRFVRVYLYFKIEARLLPTQWFAWG